MCEKFSAFRAGKTKSGPGYGLTAYKSPLGFRADKSPQNFSALHVVSDLTVLNEDIENKEETLQAISSSQNSDGGFGEQPSLLSEVFTTYCVVLTSYILGKAKYDTKRCIEFLQSCQNSDGGRKCSRVSRVMAYEFSSFIILYLGTIPLITMALSAF